MLCVGAKKSFSLLVMNLRQRLVDYGQESLSFHFLFMKVKSESEVAQSCPTPSDLMDFSLPGSSIHGTSARPWTSAYQAPPSMGRLCSVSVLAQITQQISACPFRFWKSMV